MKISQGTPPNEGLKKKKKKNGRWCEHQRRSNQGWVNWEPLTPGSPFTHLCRIYVYTAILERVNWGGEGGHQPSTGIDFVHGDTCTNPGRRPWPEKPVFWWLFFFFRCRKSFILLILDLRSDVQSSSDVRQNDVEQIDDKNSHLWSWLSKSRTRVTIPAVMEKKTRKRVEMSSLASN